MATVRLTEQAESDLLDVWHYIAQDSTEAADAWIETILRRCDHTAAAPLSGTTRGELAPGLRSIPVGNYVVLYQPTPTGIAVIRVVNGARDFGLLFEAPRLDNPDD